MRCAMRSVRVDANGRRHAGDLRGAPHEHRPAAGCRPPRRPRAAAVRGLGGARRRRPGDGDRRRVLARGAESRPGWGGVAAGGGVWRTPTHPPRRAGGKPPLLERVPYDLFATRWPCPVVPPGAAFLDEEGPLPALRVDDGARKNGRSAAADAHEYSALNLGKLRLARAVSGSFRAADRGSPVALHACPEDIERGFIMKRIAVLAVAASLAVAGFAPAAQAATSSSNDGCAQIWLIPLC